ncbi:MAG: Type II secretion system protein E [Candidatus Woesebacteria bacterium GW2011_GWA1_37_8]|uniref:Type II secretion system protein E n=1 Tax=Candidatus Woesebacteria bacterium GW2011_GWA1_37_8 TaxID=1618546 RepID=A0A0G0KVN1_9BACT|nr:MAG: Type II secretion system protein E [Candidatus Woesebacteria bacterium GW2011_GWA1_37_8]
MTGGTALAEFYIPYRYSDDLDFFSEEPFNLEDIVAKMIGVGYGVGFSLPKDIQEQVVTRVKVMAKLRTDEHQTPQDGKISYKLEDGTIDIRVSIIPITAGEKVVMRLLSDKSRRYSLSDLGLSESDTKKLVDAYNKPHGMILATGPTGSGKTTTLYAILKILNKREVNIMTIED